MLHVSRSVAKEQKLTYPVGSDFTGQAGEALEEGRGGTGDEIGCCLEVEDGGEGDEKEAKGDMHEGFPSFKLPGGVYRPSIGAACLALRHAFLLVVYFFWCANSVQFDRQIARSLGP